MADPHDWNGTEPSLNLCCGGRKCPVISQEPDGFTLSDEGVAIRLDREQAALLATWIGVRLRSASPLACALPTAAE